MMLLSTAKQYSGSKFYDFQALCVWHGGVSVRMAGFRGGGGVSVRIRLLAKIMFYKFVNYGSP